MKNALIKQDCIVFSNPDPESHTADGQLLYLRRGCFSFSQSGRCWFLLGGTLKLLLCLSHKMHATNFKSHYLFFPSNPVVLSWKPCVFSSATLLEIPRKLGYRKRNSHEFPQVPCINPCLVGHAKKSKSKN